MVLVNAIRECFFCGPLLTGRRWNHRNHAGNAHYALAVLTVTYVFNFLDRQLLAILVEPIKAEFGVSDTAMGFLYGFAFALFYATLAIPVAALADRSVRRNILAYAAGIWSLMTVLCGLAGSFLQLLLIRIGVAVGEAGGVPPSQSMVADYYPPEQRATAMAIFSSATFIGTLLALVGGAYVAAIGCYFAASRVYNDQRYEHRAGSAEAAEC